MLQKAGHGWGEGAGANRGRDIPVLGRIQRDAGHPVGDAPQHEFAHDADAQAALDQRGDGVAVLGVVADIGLHIAGGEYVGHVAVAGLLNGDKVILGKARDGIAVRMGQGVVYGQHGAEGIPLEKTGAQGRLGVEVQREGEEGAVHLALNEHGLHGAVFQIKRELNIHLGIELQKGADNLRQPLDSDAVEGAHTDGAPLQTQQLIHRVFQLPLGGAYGADAGKQVLALGRETDADPPADQKRNAPVD